MSICFRVGRALPSSFFLEEGYLAFYGTPLRAGKGSEEPARRAWRRVDDTGAPADTVMTTQVRRMASARVGELRFRLSPIPFGRSTQVRVGPNGRRVYEGWTDSLHVTAHWMNGPSEVVASVPTEGVPVEKAERDSALRR